MGSRRAAKAGTWLPCCNKSLSSARVCRANNIAKRYFMKHIHNQAELEANGASERAERKGLRWNEKCRKLICRLRFRCLKICEFNWLHRSFSSSVSFFSGFFFDFIYLFNVTLLEKQAARVLFRHSLWHRRWGGKRRKIIRKSHWKVEFLCNAFDLQFRCKWVAIRQQSVGVIWNS